DLALEPGDGFALVGGRGELVVQQLLDGPERLSSVLSIGGEVDAAKGAAAEDTLDAVVSLQDGAWAEGLVGPASGLCWRRHARRLRWSRSAEPGATSPTVARRWCVRCTAHAACHLSRHSGWSP